jgi:hypothetical protein
MTSSVAPTSIAAAVRRIGTGVALFAAVHAAILPAQTRSFGVIKGRVTDTTGRAVGGAAVELAGTAFRTLSDSAGSFLLRDVVPGRYRFSIRHVGFDPLVLNATVFADDTVDATTVLHGGVVQLDPVGRGLRGPNDLLLPVDR